MKMVYLLLCLILCGCLTRNPDDPIKVMATITAYCPGECCCGIYANGRTSTNSSAYDPGCSVAPFIIVGKLKLDFIPYGSIIKIPGMDPLIANDTGAAMREAAKNGIFAIDIRCQTHEEALKIGRTEKIISIEIKNIR